MIADNNYLLLRMKTRINKKPTWIYYNLYNIALQTAADNRLGSRNVGAPHTACAVRQGTVNSRRTRRRMTSSGRATVPGSASRATRGPSCPQRRENATLPNPLHPAHPLRTCLDAPRLDQGAYSQLPASHSHRLPSRRAPSTS